jgi:hypothetical protein
MAKPKLERSQHAQEDFYAFIGRVSLRLVESNIDAITVANFLREVMATGVHPLTIDQAMDIAQNYVEFVDA